MGEHTARAQQGFNLKVMETENTNIVMDGYMGQIIEQTKRYLNLATQY